MDAGERDSSCYRISLSINLAATFSDVVCMKYGERQLTKSAVARSVDEWSIFVASPRMTYMAYLCAHSRRYQVCVMLNQLTEKATTRPQN